MITTQFAPGSATCSANRRHGAAAILVALMLIFMLGLAAFAVDNGYLYMSYAQLQTCADSGALAGAQSLVNDSIVKPTPDYASAQSTARAKAVEYASANRVGKDLPQVDLNSANSADGDVVIGYLADPKNPECQMVYGDTALYNAIQVRVRKSSSMNGLVPTFFAKAWGHPGHTVAAKATAMISSSVVGFKVTSETGNADILPFAVKLDRWNEMLAGIGSDTYRYNQDGTVTSGADDILEINMYPLSNGISGNYGTVDVGSPNNSTADLSRQIREGVNANDLAYLGGELKLGSDGTLVLNGDTGVSAGIKDDLEFVKGQPRTIMLYSTVSGNGNNAMYTIVGFVGVRIVNVKLTGNPKHVIVQPAVVIDASAIVDDTIPSESKYTYSSAHMVR